MVPAVTPVAAGSSFAPVALAWAVPLVATQGYPHCFAKAATRPITMIAGDNEGMPWVAPTMSPRVPLGM